ncbi:sialidase family protein [Pseudactinotalea sp. HY158]|uniref:exo-alpha-sialidase n=1 Tax=Pseudactinotalea sp. HY158 TaxID=2654547 RepID=UPI00129CA150|nr:sialidase family protein [Pseudactinotalea sp. HY158]QGH68642.1 neuraminidase (sialidase) [Pseudactinotalea sp. HY158]
MSTQLAPPDFDREWVSREATGVQVHAPSVVATHTGLLAAWFAGAHEGSADTRIWLSARGEGGWWDARMIAAVDDAHWNPVLCPGPDGLLWLFFKRGSAISSWITWVVTSPDGGRTWGEPRPLVEGEAGHGGRGPVKNPPIVAGDMWLAPGSTETWGRDPRWDPFIDGSDDDGITWRRFQIPVDHTTLTGAGLIQPALWRNATTGRVSALMRSTEGVAYRSCSDDDGRNWNVAVPTRLPNSNSALAIQALPSGRVVCVHNSSSRNWGTRCPLLVSTSDDDGATWSVRATVDDGLTAIDSDPGSRPARPRTSDAPTGTETGVRTQGRGEYSYPSICRDGDDLVICYTWQRRRIAQARIALRRLDTSTQVEERRR